jgi:hypothetical protein
MIAGVLLVALFEGDVILETAQPLPSSSELMNQPNASADLVSTPDTDIAIPSADEQIGSEATFF